MKAMISTDMKQINRKVVFDIIRNKRTVTRVELSELTGISGPTILAIVNEFIEKGILSTSGKKEGCLGRSPITMTFNPDILLSIGIEFERNSLSAGLINLDGEVRFQTMAKVPSSLGDSFFEAICRSIDKLNIIAQKEKLSYKGLGFGIPGAIDPVRRIVHFAPHMGVTSPIDISEQIKVLEEKYQIPVFIENDVNVSAVGEFYIRQMQESFPDLLYVSVGAGIGAGLILDGKLRHGINGLCGEIGYSLKDIHSTVSREQTGWLETMLSPETLCGRFDSYRECGRVDEEMADYVAEILCPVIANLANTLDLNLVVVGGSLFLDGGSLLKNRVKDRIRQLTLSDITVQGSATEYIGMIGSALMASNQIYETIL